MFRYFPANYDWNLSVDLAIEMGARIGEVAAQWTGQHEGDAVHGRTPSIGPARLQKRRLEKEGNFPVPHYNSINPGHYIADWVAETLGGRTAA